MAARRAKLAQRNNDQGLQGNPDACHPRRGVVGPSYGSFASGQARKLIPSAGPPLPTEPASLGFGGGPNYRKHQPMGRAAMPARSLLCPYSAPPPWTPGPGPAGPGGFPTAFDSKSGAPAAQARPARGGHPGKKRRVRDAAPSSQTERGGRPQVAPTDVAPSRTPGHLLLPRWGNSPCRAPRGQQLRGKRGG